MKQKGDLKRTTKPKFIQPEIKSKSRGNAAKAVDAKRKRKAIEYEEAQAIAKSENVQKPPKDLDLSVPLVDHMGKYKPQKGVTQEFLIPLKELAYRAKMDARRPIKDLARWFQCSTDTLECEPYKSIIKQARMAVYDHFTNMAMEKAKHDKEMLRFLLKEKLWKEPKVEPNLEVGLKGFTISFMGSDADDDDEE